MSLLKSKVMVVCLVVSLVVSAFGPLPTAALALDNNHQGMNQESTYYDEPSDMQWSRFEEDNSGIETAGRWMITKNKNFSEGRAVWSNTIGDWIEFTFEGRAIRWIGSSGPNGGVAEVYLDETVYTVEPSISKKNQQNILFEALDLSPGSHTIRILVISPVSELESAKIYLDAFEVGTFPEVGAGGIAGCVMNELGEPIIGADVWAVPTAWDGTAYFGLSDTEGCYEIRGVPSGMYYVFAFAEGYTLEHYDGAGNSVDDATPVEVLAPDITLGIHFALTRAGSISGRVVDEEGHPIEWADVWAEATDGSGSCYGTTDGEGYYTITGLKSGDYVVRAIAQGKVPLYFDNAADYWEATVVTVTAPVDTGNINFQLTAGGSIAGRVVDEEGSPVEGAVLWAIDGNWNYFGEVSTDSDGQYTIAGLPDGDFRVYVQAEGYAFQYYSTAYNYDDASPVTVAAPDVTGGIDFVLTLGGGISGRVTDREGNPIADAWVHAHTYGVFDGGNAYGGFTDCDGFYTISGVLSGDYSVVAFAEGYTLEYYDGAGNIVKYATPVEVLAPDITLGIHFALTRAGSISGRVVDEDGHPIEEAFVWAEAADGSGGNGSTTDAEGYYTITGLVSGDYVVRAQAQGKVPRYFDNAVNYGDASVVTVTASANTGNINFQLTAGGSISGQVIDGEGNPVEGAVLWAIDGNWNDFGEVFTDTDGQYTISGLPDGDYRVYVQAEGYALQYYSAASNYDDASLVTVAAPYVTGGIDFALTLGGGISGRVTDTEGNPIADAWVHARTYGVFDGGNAYSGFTDSDGFYTISGMLSGDYSVFAVAAGYALELYDGAGNIVDDATAITVFAPAITEGIDFALTRAGSISGRVVDEEGNPIEGANVSAQGNRGRGNGSTTDAEGYYTIIGLVSGDYVVRVEAEGKVPLYFDNVVDYDEATVVTVTAPADTGNISFQLTSGVSIFGGVVDEENEPIEAVMSVDVTEDNDNGYDETIDTEGYE
jgi:protocatechuate 3,4-dioxygenase beta subunit